MCPTRGGGFRHQQTQESLDSKFFKVFGWKCWFFRFFHTWKCISQNYRFFQVFQVVWEPCKTDLIWTVLFVSGRGCLPSASFSRNKSWLGPIQFETECAVADMNPWSGWQFMRRFHYTWSLDLEISRWTETCIHRGAASANNTAVSNQHMVRLVPYFEFNSMPKAFLNWIKLDEV